MKIMLRCFLLVVVCGAVLRRLQRLSFIALKRKANQARSILSPDETGASTFKRTNSKGVEIYCRRWGSISNAKGVAVVIHSEFLNGSCFRYLAEKLMDQSIVTYALDLTGFGKSGCQHGIPSHIDAYTDYVDDVHSIVNIAKIETNQSQVMLCGEGLGGTIALAYCLSADYAGSVAALVISAPKLKPSIAPETVEGGFYGFVAKLNSRAMGPREAADEDIASLFDNEEVGLTARDNFESLQPASVQKIREIGALCEFVTTNMERITHPLLIVHGEDDKQQTMQQSEELKLKVASKTKDLRAYRDAKHGLLIGDPTAERDVIGDVIGFLVTHMKASA